jgi:hypothetical protein
MFNVLEKELDQVYVVIPILDFSFWQYVLPFSLLLLFSLLTLSSPCTMLVAIMTCVLLSLTEVVLIKELELRDRRCTFPAPSAVLFPHNTSGLSATVSGGTGTYLSNRHIAICLDCPDPTRPDSGSLLGFLCGAHRTKGHVLHTEYAPQLEDWQRDRTGRAYARATDTLKHAMQCLPMPVRVLPHNKVWRDGADVCIARYRIQISIFDDTWVLHAIFLGPDWQDSQEKGNRLFWPRGLRIALHIQSMARGPGWLAGCMMRSPSFLGSGSSPCAHSWSVQPAIQPWGTVAG